MKNIKFLAALLLVSLLATSCYEDFIQDNEVTATYFSSQKPLRTIVPRDNTASIELGAVLTGIRNDDEKYYVDYVVDTTLLDSIPEASALKLLPSSYYTIGGVQLDYSTAYNEVLSFETVKPFLRVTEVVFNVDSFNNNALTLDETYAIPLRIVDSYMDTIINAGEKPSITSGDISIVVVKYISPYSGTYYSRGYQYEFDASGNPVDTADNHYEEDLSANDMIDLTTINLNTVETSRIGKNLPGSWVLEVDENGNLNVSSSDVTNIVVNSDTRYDAENTTYYLDIEFENFGIKYQVIDELVLSQPVEKELRREEW